MEQRRLGSTGFHISVLAVGTCALGAEPELWGNVDDNESISAIATALDAGVNLIDTAPVHGAGHAERIVGRAVAGRRANVLIATKCGLSNTPDSSTGRRQLTPESIVTECEQSLRRLKTDYIDLYQCHSSDPAAADKHVFGALADLKAQGKIRAIGLTHWSCEPILRAMEFARIASVQPPLSMLNRRVLEDLVPFCREHDLAVLAYGALSKGLLAAKFDAASTMTGIRKNDPQFTGRRFRDNLAVVDRLRPIAESYGRTTAQLAVRWVLQQAGVTSVIVGAKRPSQVIENLGAADFTIDEPDLAAIDRLLQEL